MDKKQINDHDERAKVASEVRNAIYSYLHDNKSVDKCILQKYAKAAFAGLRYGRPLGTVSE